MQAKHFDCTGMVCIMKTYNLQKNQVSGLKVHTRALMGSDIKYPIRYSFNQEVLTDASIESLIATTIVNRSASQAKL